MAKKIVGLVAFLALFVGLPYFTYLIVNNKIVIGYNIGYQPDQPIPFSHEMHAGNLKMDCRYCHTAAEQTRHSSVPSLNVCMNCHNVVKTDSPHIQKLSEAFYSGGSVQWEKVHLLPDHVKFNHAAHLLSGKGVFKNGGERQACYKCHGVIVEMPVVYQHSSLSMGWCVNCHRDPEYDAPTNCSTCHY